MKESIKTFEFTGTHIEKGKKKTFKKMVQASTENFAIEKLLSQIGSKHGTQRRHISIQEMKEQKTEAGK